MIFFNGKSQKWIKGFVREIWKLLKETISVLIVKQVLFSVSWPQKNNIYIPFSSKGFSHRVYTVFFRFDCLQSFSKPLMIEDFSCFKKSYISKIHFACSGLKSFSFNLTLTSTGALTSLSCWLTFSAYHSLNILVINLFPFDWQSGQVTGICW